VNQFLCCHCGKEVSATIDDADLPRGWARLTFERTHAIDDKPPARTTLTTHACGDCTVEILVFLEKKTLRKPIDDAFDHGGGE
jgi:hypothetical protein